MLFQPFALGVGNTEAVIVGGATTVNATPLLEAVPTVTTTFPEVAPGGTVAMRLVALQLVTVAVVPLNFNVLVPCVEPKLAPMMLMDFPMEAEEGEMVEIVGDGVTEK